MFATSSIGKDTWLGEYLGELVPVPRYYDPNDRYMTEVEETALIGTRQFGNWTRFVNHHCNPNVRITQEMYGGRKCMLLRASTDIEVGDQLYVNFGSSYFDEYRRTCTCDAEAGPHVPNDDDDDDYESDHVEPTRARGEKRGAA